VDRDIVDFHEYIADTSKMQRLIQDIFDGVHEDMAAEAIQHQLDLVRLAEPRLRDTVHDDMVQGCEREQRQIDRTCGKLHCTAPWGPLVCAASPEDTTRNFGIVPATAMSHSAVTDDRRMNCDPLSWRSAAIASTTLTRVALSNSLWNRNAARTTFVASGFSSSSSIGIESRLSR
jgi:uncharacterized protein YeeX (DUF496 family)